MNTNSKDIYDAPQAEVIEVKVESVICDSTCPGENENGGNNPSGPSF